MKAVILAGGLGSRISEETESKPKPMIEIGGRPILWHIMKIYAKHGIKDFIICIGYKGYYIKEYFMNYFLHQSDVTFDIKNHTHIIHNNNSEDWKVTIVDTGEFNMTGSRIKQIHKYIKDDELFCLTYGDGLSDVNIAQSIEFHKNHGKLATLTAVRPTGRFGTLNILDKKVVNFKEKPSDHNDWVNGGFFVMSPKTIEKYIDNDEKCVFEQQALQNLAKDGQLMSFHHDGFWQPMDTLRDKQYLEKMWNSNDAKWKTW